MLQSKKNNQIFSSNKKIVQEKIWNILRLDVDIPRQGFGTTTTENCAKNALENKKKTAKILEINKYLIENLNLLVKIYILIK